MSLPAGVVVGLEPLHGLVDSLLEGDEQEIWEVGAQLGVAGGLLELPVRLGGVKDQLALEVHGLGDGVGHISDGHLILLTNYPNTQTHKLRIVRSRSRSASEEGTREKQKQTRENDGSGLLVLAEGPDEEPGQILGENELAEGLASARHNKVLALLLGQVELVNQTWDHMAVLKIKVVVGTIHIGGHNTGEVASILLVVGPAKEKVTKEEKVGKKKKGKSNEKSSSGMAENEEIWHFFTC